MMNLLTGYLQRHIVEGALSVIGPDGTRSDIGDGTGPQVTMRIHDGGTALRIAMRPELALGEAYMDGKVTVDAGTLADLFQIVGRNRERLLVSAPVRLRQRVNQLLLPLYTMNHRSRARRNVAHHYDLSADLYATFLDEGKQYSCAYFSTDGMTLEQAQLAKQNHLASKLDLRDGMRVLDIGSGWGGLALRLASLADVEVLGITLSQEQHKASNEAAAAAGVSDRVRFELRDWRDVQGSFDRIVSVGMFEHVGPPLYVQFFAKLRELLDTAGIALLHSIGKRKGPTAQAPWIAKYIFPGGYTPVLSETVEAIESSGMWIADIENLRGMHYAETLRAWRERFAAERTRFAQAYDERFCRMWEFYLNACEAEFRYGDAHVFQILLARTRSALRTSRDYMLDTERKLNAA